MKIAVLLGGTSAERDVSIASGSQVVETLRRAGHTAVAVDTAVGVLDADAERQCLRGSVAARPPDADSLAGLGRDRTLELVAAGELSDFDVAFLALHGGSGENGTVQAALTLAGIPFTGSGYAASAVALDKELSKRLLRDAGIGTPDWRMAPAADGDLRALGLPLVVKSNKQGSTVGLTIVRESDALEAAIAEARRHDDEVLIERFVPGREVTCAVLDDAPLGVGEIIPQRSDHFDYESKYQDGGAIEVFPAELDAATTERVRALSLAVHRTLKLEGYSRIDFRLDADGGLWCLEANTLPGLTKNSLLPQSARCAGIEFAELLERICHLGMTCRR